jgi:hypothetical protein
VHYERVGAAKKGLGRAVAAGLTAQGADHGDGLEGKLIKAGGDIAPARLARDHEGFAMRQPLEHGDSIGEYKAKSKVDKCRDGKQLLAASSSRRVGGKASEEVRA